MVQKNVLIVEDDEHVLKLIKHNLEIAGFRCKTTITGENALEILDNEDVDLIILDIILPGKDGFTICKEIKQNKLLAFIPIIILSAKGEERDRIIGFETGADDYMVKPFSPRELILRVKALLKHEKSVGTGEEVLTFSRITVDVSCHKVTENNKEIQLTVIEFNLLLVLLKKIGRVQSRSMLLRDIWDISSNIRTRTIDTHINRLRQKLGGSGKLIETVRGLGYRLSS